MWKRTRTDHIERAQPELSSKLEQLAMDNERMHQELARMQQHFRSLARSVWRVQEDERRRLARELHDGVGQSLTALRHRVERLPDHPDRDAAVDLVVQILDDVREMSRLLRPPVLDDLGLAAAMQWLGRRVRESANLDVEVDAAGADGLELEPDLETLVFRVVQEALHNTVRHSGASRVKVLARRAGDRLEINIQDNGRGFDPASLGRDPEKAGVGLTGMRDRAALFGGDLAIRAAVGRGTGILLGLALSRQPSPGDTEI